MEVCRCNAWAGIPHVHNADGITLVSALSEEDRAGLTDQTPASDSEELDITVTRGPRRIA